MFQEHWFRITNIYLKIFIFKFFITYFIKIVKYLIPFTNTLIIMYINNYHNYQIIYKQFIKVVMTKVVSLYTYIFLESCVPRP